MRSDPPSPGNHEPGGATGSHEESAPPGWARWVSRISLVIALVAFAVTIWTVGLSSLLTNLRAIGWWFVAILALEGAITALDALAIHRIASEGGAAGFGRVLFAQIAGRAVNLVTPASTLGEATKASILTQTMGTSRAVAAVLYVALVSGIFQLAVIAVGAPLTALLLPLPAALRFALIMTALVAATLAITLTILVRRGMLSSLVEAGGRLRIVSKKRRDKWRTRLRQIDDRLRGTEGTGRRVAIGYVIASKFLTWLSIWVILAAIGYFASVGEIAALLSAGVVLGWLATIVPMGLGITESGNYALFRALGAPPAVGVALAVARRIVHLVFAGIGFVLLAVWRASSSARSRIRARTRPKGVPHVDTQHARHPVPVRQPGG
jgi:uncharacterized protein (TIRG00374 family)